MPDIDTGGAEVAKVTPIKAKESDGAPTTKEATIAAGNLVDRKVRSVAQSHIKIEGGRRSVDTQGMSDDEFNLYKVGLLKAGLTEDEYKAAGDTGYSLQGGLEVTTKDGRSVTITSLVGEIDDEDGKTYKAITETEDPDKPGEKLVAEVDVLATEVVRSHMEKNAQSIAANFTDGGEKSLVDWHAKGGTGEPPEAAINLLEKEAVAPLIEADNIITTVSESLKSEIGALKDKDALSEIEQQSLQKKEALLAKMNLSLAINGENFAEFARYAALQELKRHGVKELDDLQDALKPEAKAAYQTLREMLKNEGATPEELDKLETLGFEAFKDDSELLKKLIKVKDIDKLVFGREVNSKDILGLFKGTLTPEQQKWFDENKDKLGSGILTALLIILAAPVVAAVGATIAGTATASVLSGRKAA